ncbi:MULTISPECIES: dephospho-CoA kinase [unclassified Spirosoma]|uniref:dephospho-CoA kinase n=1 Tax=unclassified Spirosoma TaxID=2621999 RepID=UPI00095E80A7|nr:MULTISPECIES: dephospho-CoA kinase [unclassified Spirosoma]MBN8821775.1 dephospho-CoA kinase [Spirosoma sp.]OJW80734.1 MAG: dephospho-CoA kinase [Spirosoma sp. 48-14]
MKSPLQIGVTGGIGSGKTIVCQVFRALGIPVYEADERAKWLTEHDPILKADIKRVLGPEAYDVSGRYNRAWVASQVFGNPERLTALNAVIHPRVFADTASWITQQTGKSYVIKEAALMKAAGDNNSLDKVVVVQAPVSLRIERIRKRDPHRPESEIQNIIARQISDDDRMKIADYVLENDESQLLLPQIIHLHEEFLRIAAN